MAVITQIKEILQDEDSDDDGVTVDQRKESRVENSGSKLCEEEVQVPQLYTIFPKSKNRLSFWKQNLKFCHRHLLYVLKFDQRNRYFLEKINKFIRKRQTVGK